MEKVISIRADESVRKDLKLLAALKEVSVGQVLEELVRAEMAKWNRASRVLSVAEEEGPKKNNANGQARKKKRGY